MVIILFPYPSNGWKYGAFYNILSLVSFYNEIYTYIIFSITDTLITTYLDT